MAQTKVELLLEIKERINTGLKKARDAVSQSTKEMQSKLSALRGSFVSAFSEMRRQVPLLDSGLRLLTNPFVLVTSAVLSLGSAVASSTRMALDWEAGMAKINVTAQLTKRELSDEA